MAAVVGDLQDHLLGDIALVRDQMSRHQRIVARVDDERGNLHVFEQHVRSCPGVVVLGAAESMQGAADPVIELEEGVQPAQLLPGDSQLGAHRLDFPRNVMTEAPQQVPLVNTREPALDLLDHAAQVERSRHPHGCHNRQRLASLPTFAQPLQADIRAYGAAHDGDRHSRLSLVQAMDQVVQVAGHPAVIALRQAVDFAVAAIVQQHAAPAAHLARAQQASHIGRSQVALQSRQHDHDRAVRPRPVQPRKIPVGKLQTFRTRFEPNLPSQNGPESLGVSPRQPPTRLEVIDGHESAPPAARLRSGEAADNEFGEGMKVFDGFARRQGVELTGC